MHVAYRLNILTRGRLCVVENWVICPVCRCRLTCFTT